MQATGRMVSVVSALRIPRRRLIRHGRPRREFPSYDCKSVSSNFAGILLRNDCRRRSHACFGRPPNVESSLGSFRCGSERQGWMLDCVSRAFRQLAYQPPRMDGIPSRPPATSVGSCAEQVRQLQNPDRAWQASLRPMHCSRVEPRGERGSRFHCLTEQPPQPLHNQEKDQGAVK